MLSVVALALGCGLVTDDGVLEAIVRVESGGNPFALAVNGDVELVREPRSREEAVGMARWLERHGYNFDAGLAQVNSANMARLGLDVVSVFDPCANLRAASRVLDECFERALLRFGGGERALTAALSCYNTGHFTRGVTNGYVAAVRANASGPLVLRAHEGTERAVATDGARAGRRRSDTERSGSRAAVRAGRIARATRRADAFAHPVADAFGAARPAGREGAP
jgi:type IV secretion system protein VirB1